MIGPLNFTLNLISFYATFDLINIINIIQWTVKL